MKLPKIHLLFLCLTFGLMACEEDKTECENVGCTEEFRTITLELTDQNGEAVLLDDYHTYLDQYNLFTIDKAVNSGFPQFYPVFSDAQMDLLDFEGKVFIFVGFIDGEVVIEQAFEVAKDCCHIQLIRGETKAQIEVAQ